VTLVHDKIDAQVCSFNSKYFDISKENNTLASKETRLPTPTVGKGQLVVHFRNRDGQHFDVSR
jgi:hypothetical protein